MNSIYIDQSANDLRLNLLYSKLDKSSLNVIVSESIFYNDIKIEVGIIGASHYINIQHKEDEFSEVFACLELNDSSKKCEVKKVSELSEVIIENINDNISYSFTSQILNWNAESSKEYEQFTKDTILYSKDTHSLGLSHVFPYKKNDKYIAKTELYITQIEENIIIRTLHAYPNEEKLVFTKTSIKNIRNINE